MKRVRGILITVLIIGLLGGIGSFAARRAAASSSGRVVEVTAVGNVNEYMGYSNFDLMEGVIISKDTQAIYKNSGYTLKEVYAHEGDKVSKGDKLLEYDMEKVELEAEKAGLDQWGLELELESMEKQLDLLKRGIVPVDEDTLYRYSERTESSADDDSDDSDDDSDYDDASYDDEEYVDVTGSADIVEEGGLISDSGDGQLFSQDEDAFGYIVEDDEETFIIEEDNDPDSGSYAPESGSGISTEDGEDPQIALIRAVNSFLSTVNEVTEIADTSLSALGEEDVAEKISSALEDFRSKFGSAIETQQVNLLGESITVTDYTVNDTVESIVGETTTHVMENAYDMLLAYQFASAMERLNPDGKSSASESVESVKSKESLLRTAANLIASMPASVFNANQELFNTAYDALNNKWTADGKESRVEYLKALASLLNGATVVEEPEEIPDTVSTEGNSMYDVGDGVDYDGDDGDSEPVNFAELIKEMENSIFEQKLLIREAKLEVKEYDEKLKGRIVYAQLDGVVLSEGSASGSKNSPIMVVTGKKGLYVKGLIKENSLDTVNVGDTVYGSTYDSTQFTAEIVEISTYPESGNNSYFYGFGDENSNESSYPFLAFIENTEGLEVDDGVELSLNGEISGFGYSMEEGLALNSAFIRTEESGRAYCLVEGEDGLLEKRYLQLGNNEWGTVTIKSGLSREDYIAFPYGKGVVEGSKTTRVDELKAMSYDSGFYG